jgi:hypothetical protein
VFVRDGEIAVPIADVGALLTARRVRSNTVGTDDEVQTDVWGSGLDVGLNDVHRPFERS